MLSGHKFAHVMTAELSWHVQNCDLIGYLFDMKVQNIIFEDFEHEFISLL